MSAVRELEVDLASALLAASAVAAEGAGTKSASNARTADICVVAHVDEDAAELIAELPDGSRLPRPVLDELTCNALITGAVFDRCGEAIWKTSTRRDANTTQRRILNAKWGGCFHCGANFAICQPHHIEAFSRGGPTRIENLVPACWSCHQLIHRDGWQIHRSPDGKHTLHPPQRVHYGPAHAPEDHRHVIADPPLVTAPAGFRAEDGHEALLAATAEINTARDCPALDAMTRPESKPAAPPAATTEINTACGSPAPGGTPTRTEPAPPLTPVAKPQVRTASGASTGLAAARATLRNAHVRAAHSTRDGPDRDPTHRGWIGHGSDVPGWAGYGSAGGAAVTSNPHGSES